jgi:hypothetical protein
MSAELAGGVTGVVPERHKERLTEFTTNPVEAGSTDAHALENGAAVLPSETEYSGGSKTEFLPYKASNSLSSRSSMR